MATAVCPHCRIASHFLHQHSYKIHHGVHTDDYQTVVLHACARCGMPLVEVLEEDKTIGRWPSAVTNRLRYPDVPEGIADLAREAHASLAAGATRAAVLMARSTVEAVAKDKGITNGSLVHKIDQLRAGEHISALIAEAAHEIRFAGNEAAHGPLDLDPVSSEDAEAITRLMDKILERVYHEPAEIEYIRMKRTLGPATAQRHPDYAPGDFGSLPEASWVDQPMPPF